MARVLKKIPKVEKQVVCNHCGSAIAYVKNDIKTYSYGDYGGGTNVDSYITCPDDGCGEKIILSSS